MLEWIVTICLVVPALLFAVSRSTWLVDYAFLVYAFNRGIRRYVDYQQGAFNPLSPISLTPLIVGGLLFFPFYANQARLTPNVRRIFNLFIGAMAYALAIGLLRNRLAAVYSLAEYWVPISLMGFVAVSGASQAVRDRWIRSVAVVASGVAAYGWYQYLTIPPWDAFWVQAVGFVGYLGQLEPGQMTVISTLHERGPCAGFLAWAAIPMVLVSRWRKPLGWLGVSLIASAIPLTGVRTAIISIILVLVLHPFLHRGRSIFGVFVFAALVMLGAEYGSDKVIGNERIRQRMSTVSEVLTEEDGSIVGRLEIAKGGLRLLLFNPWGFGLGSAGLAGRVNSGNMEANGVIGDNGYLEVLLPLGVPGGAMFVYAMVLIWRECTARYRAGIRDDFVMISRSTLVALVILMFSGNFLTGLSVFWLFFGAAMAPEPVARLLAARRRLLAEREQRMRNNAQTSESGPLDGAAPQGA